MSQLTKEDKSLSLNLLRKLSSGKCGPYHLFTINAYEPSADDDDRDEWDVFNQYKRYNGYNGYIDNAIERDPENTWNTD